MKRLIVLLALVFLVLTSVLAQTKNKKSISPGRAKIQDASLVSSQDPYIIAPQAYKREFENEQVKVTFVRYKPREIIESHDHPELPTVYVYLRNSGPVRFIHTGDGKFIAVRPAVKAGGFRLGRGSKETHKVESLTDQPSEFLRVELKDFKVDKNTFRGRFPPETRQTISKNSETVGFENRQIRITRVTCAAHSLCASSSQTSPYLLVGLTSSQLKKSVNNETLSNLKMKLGQTMWIEAGEPLRLVNSGTTTIRFLRIELKAKN